MNIARSGVSGILLVMACAGSACGEGMTGLHLFASLGPSVPLAKSRLNSYWAAGPGLSGGIGYDISHNLTLALAIDYGRYEWDGKFESRYHYDPMPVSGEGSQVLALTSLLRTSIWRDSGPVRPYFAHGIGLFKVSFGTVEIIDPYDGPKTLAATSETVVGIVYGMGIDFSVSRRILVFVEGKYLWAFTLGSQATQILPIGLGVRLR